MRTKYKPWAEPYIKEHQEVMISLEEFIPFKDVNLEIGSGKGQFLIEMAAKFPNQQFVGVERNVTCAGFTAKKIVESKLTNAKLIFGDAGILLTKLEDSSINNIFLNFSDPWPKRRHTKRRLTAPSFLEGYERVLKDNGLLIFKTDNSDLFNFSLEMFNESRFEIVSKTDDYDGSDPFDNITEYENNFRNQGIKIHRIILRKKV